MKALFSVFAAAALLGCSAAVPRSRTPGGSAGGQAGPAAPSAGALNKCGPCPSLGVDTTPLGCAATERRLDAVKEMLVQGADPSIECGYMATPSFTPLAAAARSADPAIVKALLDAGGNPRYFARMREWRSSLHDVILGPGTPEPSVESARLLVKAGAELNHKDLFYDTPLFRAALNGLPLMVEYLLAAGADPSIVNMNKKTPAMIAREKGHVEIARMIDESSGYDGRRRLQARIDHRRRLAECQPRLKAAEREGDAAAKRGQAAQALKSYAAGLRACPAGAEGKDRLATKLFAAARLVSPPPPVPRAAQDHADRAESFIRLAQDRRGFAKAADELSLALDTAPWWSEAWFNYGLALEKAGDPAGAAAALGRFLEAEPGSPQAGEIRKKMVDLQIAQELAGGAAPRPADPEADGGRVPGGEPGTADEGADEPPAEPSPGKRKF